MNINPYLKAAFITLLCLGVSLLASEQEIKTYFKAAQKGMYSVMNNITQKSLITKAEIMSSTDETGNSVISSAIQNYKLARGLYGDSKASQALFEIIARLLAKLSPAEKIKILNTPNRSGLTPLFIATKEGLLKIIVFLHTEGASSVTEDGKRASTYAQNAHIKSTLENWEELEGDWVMVKGK